VGHAHRIIGGVYHQQLSCKAGSRTGPNSIVQSKAFIVTVNNVSLIPVIARGGLQNLRIPQSEHAKKICANLLYGIHTISSSICSVAMC